MGVCSAPEVFHKTVHQFLEDIEGVSVYMDDIIVWGSTAAEHDERLMKTLQRLSGAGPEHGEVYLTTTRTLVSWRSGDPRRRESRSRENPGDHRYAYTDQRNRVTACVRHGDISWPIHTKSVSQNRSIHITVRERQ